MSLKYKGLSIELNQKGSFETPPQEFRGLAIELNQRSSYNTPPQILKGFAIELELTPYNDTQTVISKPNNTNKDGFNDWDYKILCPDNQQIKQHFSENGNTYDEILSIVASVSDVTVVNTSGILTDLNFTQT